MFPTDDCAKKDVQTHGCVLGQGWDTKGGEYHMAEGMLWWYSIISLFKETEETLQKLGYSFS